MWELFNIIGTVSFAASGAIVATEEKYDLLGIIILGYVTAFGGGITRNLITGIDLEPIWHQNTLFTIALGVILLIYAVPTRHLIRFKEVDVIFDAVGLSAFAIQGAMIAKEAGLPLIAVVAAAVATGAGGGVIRDLLARRKPMLFRSEIYGSWAIFSGLLIGCEWVWGDSGVISLFFIICMCRWISYRQKWSLPKKIY